MLNIPTHDYTSITLLYNGYPHRLYHYSNHTLTNTTNPPYYRMGLLYIYSKSLHRNKPYKTKVEILQKLPKNKSGVKTKVGI